MRMASLQLCQTPASSPEKTLTVVLQGDSHENPTTQQEYDRARKPL